MKSQFNLYEKFFAFTIFIAVFCHSESRASLFLIKFTDQHKADLAQEILINKMNIPRVLIHKRWFKKPCEIQMNYQFEFCFDDKKKLQIQKVNMQLIYSSLRVFNE